MGEVYRATDTRLSRDVAIKTLPASLAGDADRLARFEREAKLLASLNHAHIAAVYGLDEHEGTRYIAMELVEGETLEQKLKVGALPVEESLQLALQIAEALEAAHGKGVVHRDLKPANIMLTPDGQVKVLDFGLAKAFSGNPSEASPAHSPALSLAMTQAGLILGTAGYMSPEQASGQATDQRADIWAFGVVLFEMLTGLPLFSGESVPHVLAAILQTEPDWRRLPQNLHPRLKLLLERCLEKKPRSRYHSIADARVDIERALSNDPDSGVQAPAAAPTTQRLRIAIGGLLLGAILAGAAAYAWMRPGPPAPLRVSRFLVTPPAGAMLTDLGGYDMTISPDGARVIFFAEVTDEQGKHAALFRRELDTLKPQRIAGPEFPAGVPNINLFASADSAWIGFMLDEQGIMRVPIDGGTPLKIVDNPPAFVGASWASDNSIVYSGGTSLYRVSAGGGGKPELLTGGPGTQFQFAAPVFLPGNRAVLVSVNDADDQRVGVFDLQTGELNIVIEGGVQNPTYSSTGHVVFARGTTLMAAPFDIDRLEVTGDAVALIEGVRHPGPGSAADYALSDTGTLVYVPEFAVTPPRALVWVARDGEIVGRAISQPIVSANSPRLSPDNSRLALVTGRTNESELWIHDLSGRPPIPLAVERSNISPLWSPDGTRIAFASNSGGVWSLHLLPADGSILDSNPYRTDGVDLTPTAWSDDDHLIMVRCCGNLDLVSATLQPDSALQDTVVTADREIDAALSPNGRWLAYVSDRTGQAEIWVKGYPNGVARRVSANGGFEPRWSADGRELYYLQANAMMVVPVETEAEFSFSAAAELFATGSYFTSEDPYIHSYDVAGDGRFLMIEPIENPANRDEPIGIIVVENWFEELKRLVPTD